VVEYVVLLPLGLFVFLVLLQAALYIHARNVAWAAVEEGAYAAAADGATLADGRARARALLVAGLGQAGQRLPVGVQTDGDTVVVDVHGSMGLLVLGSSGPLQLPLDVRGRAVRETFRPADSP
jgi:hypothetical protein